MLLPLKIFSKCVNKKSDDKESDKKPAPEFKKSKEIEKIEDLIDEASDEIDEIREYHKIKSIPEFEQYLNKVMQDTGKKAALKKDEKKEKALKEDKKRVYDATQKIKLAKKRKNKKLSSDKEKKEAKKSIDDRLEKDKYLLKIKERMRGEKVDIPEDAKEMTLVHELKKLSDAIIELQK